MEYKVVKRKYVKALFSRISASGLHSGVKYAILLAGLIDKRSFYEM